MLKSKISKNSILKPEKTKSSIGSIEIVSFLQQSTTSQQNSTSEKTETEIKLSPQ